MYVNENKPSDKCVMYVCIAHLLWGTCVFIVYIAGGRIKLKIGEPIRMYVS